MKDEENASKERPNADSSEIQGEESIFDLLDDEELFPEDPDIVEEDSTATELPASTSSYRFQLNIDVVFVIDCTGDMVDRLDKVKQLVLWYEDGLHEFCESRGYTHCSLRIRIRIIGYRDFYYDWEDPDHPPIEASAFFNIPEQKEELIAFLDRLEAAGGEDEPASGLEALHLAFHSDWKQPEEGMREQQHIILITNSAAHKLDDPMRYDPRFNSHYPEGMPKNLEELENEYNDPDVFPSRNGIVKGHRLILFAPENEYPWSELMCWECGLAMYTTDFQDNDIDILYRMIFMS